MYARTSMYARTYARVRSISPLRPEKKETTIRIRQACVRACVRGVMRAAAVASPSSAWKRPVHCLVRSRQGRGVIRQGRGLSPCGSASQRTSMNQNRSGVDSGCAPPLCPDALSPCLALLCRRATSTMQSPPGARASDGKRYDDVRQAISQGDQPRRRRRRARQAISQGDQPGTNGRSASRASRAFAGLCQLCQSRAYVR